MHCSAERDSLVIRCSVEDREQLIADAPDTYYVTPYYRRHPVVLVRLGQVDRAVLRELLMVAGRWTLAKGRGR